MATTRPVAPHPDQLLLTVAQAGALLGLPKSSSYELVKRGEIPSVLVGGSRIRVSRDALTAYVARLEAEAEEQDRRIRSLAKRRSA